MMNKRKRNRETKKIYLFLKEESKPRGQNVKTECVGSMKAREMPDIYSIRNFPRK